VWMHHFWHSHRATLAQSELLDPAGLTAWPGFDMSSVAKGRTRRFGLIFISQLISIVPPGALYWPACPPKRALVGFPIREDGHSRVQPRKRDRPLTVKVAVPQIAFPCSRGLRGGYFVSDPSVGSHVPNGACSLAQTAPALALSLRPQGFTAGRQCSAKR
jgi:hypothetical protein